MTHESTGVDTTGPSRTVPAAPTSPTPAGTGGRHTWSPPPRRSRAGAFGLLAALLTFCALTALGGYLLIGNLTDRGPESPRAAVDGFLTALLTDRDPEAARTYVCAAIRDSDFGANLDAITAAEAATGTDVAITWDNVTTAERNGDSATVTAEVTAGAESSTWTFTVIKDPHWYVCGFAAPR